MLFHWYMYNDLATLALGIQPESLSLSNMKVTLHYIPFTSVIGSEKNPCCMTTKFESEG